MTTVRHFWGCGRAATFVWIISAIIFYLIFRAAMEYSLPSGPESLLSSSDRRSRLYDKMAQDLDEQGAKFLHGGETSQSLSLNDLFELKGGSVTPKLTVADPPVRANVLYLSSDFSIPMSKAVMSGPDPVTIRAKLSAALPHAPEKQLYDPVILHTSFARLLGRPKFPLEEMKQQPLDLLQFFHGLVARVNGKLHGFKATITELWFVEEYDVLALALNGRMKIHKFRLGCSNH